MAGLDPLAPLGGPQYATQEQLRAIPATADQLKSSREYAKALLYGAGQQPVHHWTQGVSNMVNALMGGMVDYNAAQQDKAGYAKLGHDYTPPDPNAPVSPAGIPAQRTSFDEAPPSGGHQTAEGGLSPEIEGYIQNASQKYGIDPAYLHKTAMIESSGNPNDVNARSGAAGLFQFVHGTAKQYGLNNPLDPAANTDAMGRFTADNMKQLTSALGRPPTMGELYLAHQQGVGGAMKLLSNPDAPAVRSVGLAQVMNNGGYQHMTGRQFANMWTSRFPGAAPAAQVALPNSGSVQPAMNLTSPGQPEAAQTTAAVLRGEPPQAEQVAQRGGPPPGIAQAAPYPQTNNPFTGTFVPPGLTPRVPQYPRGNVEGVISNPRASDLERENIRNDYIRQNQPLQMPVPGGTVTINPNDRTQQLFTPDIKWGEEKIGDLSRQTPQYVDPRFGVMRPGSNQPTVAPAASPAAAPVQAAPQGGATVEAGAPQNAPAAPAEPAKGTPVVAGEGGEGPLGGLKNIPPAPAGIPKDLWDANYMKKAADTKVEVNKDAQVKAADFAAKKYDTLSTQAQEARKQLPNLQLGLQLMNDPNFHAGLAAGAKDLVSRFNAAVLGDKYANASNETFDKLMAGTVLGNMKTALGGLGQVRLAEINLLDKANANRHNTVASNRAVLDLSMRAINSLDHIDQMAQQYVSGDEVRDPVTDEVLLKPNVGADGEMTPRHGLDAGFNKLATSYVKNHPTMTEDEIKHYNTIFDTGEDPNEKQATAPGQSGEGPGVKAPGTATPTSAATTQAGQTYKGYTFKGGDYRDKNNWTKAQ